MGGFISRMVDTILPGLFLTFLSRKTQKHEQSSFGTLAEFDVFLNHRGPDLKKTFVSHLNEALLRSGRKPFLDAKALVKGRKACDSMDQALSGVLVHVAVFSKGYAKSKYCLNELCDMVASEKPLIPVFYDVEPLNLRNTNDGPYAHAFRDHLKKGRAQDMVKWKAALSEAAAITGFKLRDYDGDTAILVTEIVHAVLNALPTPPPLAPARHPVGLDESSRNVIDMLHKMGDDVGVVGICGMGGIGKTTLAREVFNQEHAKFGSWCFLSNAKEANGVAIMDMQVKMVGDLLRVDAKKLQWNSAHWFDHIRNHRREVFVVIDDISSRQQFDQLIPDLKCLPRGSRVLVTSREIDVLKSIIRDVPKGELYDVAELGFRESLDLFVWCAFQTKSIGCVDASFHDFVEKIVKACGGLPLALEVMGGSLSDKRNLPDDEMYWREATAHLQKHQDVTSRLQISYDGLVEEDKLMFLDIACFMLGHPKRVAIEVWDSSGRYESSSWSLSRLIDKCLVKVEGGWQLSMHDLLRDMGRNVVKERASYKPELQRHVWDPSVAAKVLQKKQGSDEIEALSVIGERSDTVCKAEVYARMRGLRYLLLDSCRVNGDFSNWSEELRWLQWRDFPYTELPATVTLPNLAVLDLADSKSITRIWARDLELEIHFPKLRMLVLSHCTELRELPEQINKLVKLKYMDLEGCGSLEVLPESVGDLTELDYLNLCRCKRLKYLPDSIVRLKNLRELCLRSSGLRKLPIELGRLERLAVLNAAETAIDELPKNISQMQALQKISFRNCKLLRNLNEDFGCLRRLRRLNLEGCERLTELPNSISNLSNLEYLRIGDCKLLTGLPPSVCGLKKLRKFTMRLLGVRELPEDFGELQSLREVEIVDCEQLQSLPQQFGCLSSLQTLKVRGCERLSKLEYLRIDDYKLLTGLPPSVCGLKKVRVFTMRALGVRELPEDFGELQSLRDVNILYCEQLQSLPQQFGCLSSLQSLEVRGCERLTMFPELLSRLCSLESLYIGDCKLLTWSPPSVYGGEI